MEIGTIKEIKTHEYRVGLTLDNCTYIKKDIVYLLRLVQALILNFNAH